MGRRSAQPEPEAGPDIDRRRRNLARQIRLSSKTWVRDHIDRNAADRLGLGDLHYQKVGGS